MVFPTLRLQLPPDGVYLRALSIRVLNRSSISAGAGEDGRRLHIDA